MPRPVDGGFQRTSSAVGGVHSTVAAVRPGAAEDFEFHVVLDRESFHQNFGLAYRVSAAPGATAARGRVQGRKESGGMNREREGFLLLVRILLPDSSDSSGSASETAQATPE